MSNPDHGICVLGMTSMSANISRRNALGVIGGLGSTLVGNLPPAEGSGAAISAREDRRLKVLVVGGHPDDPESGCGGTMARFADTGHEVVALYLTRGEAGIPGKSHVEAASIRTAECLEACKILKARPAFAGQIDGSTEINANLYDEMRRLLQSEEPDIVLAHWPIDTHRDHRAASFLVYDAWIHLSQKFALYYFEVMSGSQTQNFSPTDYVDITTTEGRKRAACFAHKSQNPEGFYSHHDMMNKFRGLESGHRFAEAFVRHVRSRGGMSP
jgi:N-acetylglucosamine malate deacetylase 1